jgi:hypothetical protein
MQHLFSFTRTPPREIIRDGRDDGAVSGMTSVFASPLSGRVITCYCCHIPARVCRRAFADGFLVPLAKQHDKP